MKYFFGMDITENEENDIYDGERYAAARVDGELGERIEEAASLAQKADELCRVSPAPRKMGQTCLIFAAVWGLLLIFGLVRGTAELTSAPMLVTGAMVLISAVAGVLLLRRAAKISKKTPEQEEAVRQANESFARVIADSARQLGVPENCPDTDVLHSVYSVKDGVPELYSMMGTKIHMSYPRKVFVKDGDLCISDIRKLYRIPVSALGELETVREKTGLGFWNKEKSFRSPEYAPYNIRASRGALVTDSYVRLTATLDNEEYVLLFPPYEKENLEKMLGR